ncbi:MAG: cysteine synthase A [Kiritimatiellia bacterium]|jgi:cysteine synthase A|nr:cysteine synthase A [Kiritimatiellia bacterium]MDD4172818.1 cysteine synthase A [Kiritimatiellia bacterium]MDD4440954.1 cysteine synthase A [Kiritimatiellia bacterium]MDX9792177.1 cysteine synthase A [Kiritimatiellia bacterium]NLC79570.1 cysteine synthase A [Lentisphaerota bacterium]
MTLFDDNSLTIGNTPLVRLNRLARGLGATVAVKVEGRNPAYSVKCRTAASMVWEAERDGTLKPGMEIVEPTSGNTGIALAMVAAARGYTVTLAMPESMSIERRRVLAALGANLVLTPAAAGMAGAVQRAKELMRESPGRFFMPDQFSNPANPLIHERTTGPEIWAQTDGQVAAVVAGVGTGGTIVGTGRAFKNLGAKVQMVAVEPAESPLLTQRKAGGALAPAPHGIQGIGANFIPQVVDFSVIDRVESVSTAEATETSRRLAREEGILSGISCGAAVAAALRLAAEDVFAGRLVVAILPDSGERYLSTPLFA